MCGTEASSSLDCTDERTILYVYEHVGKCSCNAVKGESDPGKSGEVLASFMADVVVVMLSAVCSKVSSGD